MLDDVQTPTYHPIFTHDPAEWLQYVYKKVTVATNDNKVHEGWVYTIDPVSQSIVLVQFEDQEQAQLTMIMDHAVTKTTIVAEASPGMKERLDAMFHPEAELELSCGELKARQQKLKFWFVKNRVPVELQGELLVVSNALTIHPPYGVDDCLGTNEIILSRIRGLMQNIPADHDQW